MEGRTQGHELLRLFFRARERMHHPARDTIPISSDDAGEVFAASTGVEKDGQTAALGELELELETLRLHRVQGMTGCTHNGMKSAEKVSKGNLATAMNTTIYNYEGAGVQGQRMKDETIRLCLIFSIKSFLSPFIPSRR